MFGLSKRIQIISVDIGQQYKVYFNADKLKTGLMGLRFSKKQEGIYIHYNKSCTFVPWDKIQEMNIWF